MFDMKTSGSSAMAVQLPSGSLNRAGKSAALERLLAR